MLELCRVDASRVSREALDAHVALAVARADRPWIQRTFAESARSLLRELLLGKRLRQELREPGPPTLIVHGQRDRLVDVRAARAVAAANPAIGLTEMPDLGHVPQLEAPEAFLAIALPWLERVTRLTNGSPIR